jgi:hypothetical protein
VIDNTLFVFCFLGTAKLFPTVAAAMHKGSTVCTFGI